MKITLGLLEGVEELKKIENNHPLINGNFTFVAKKHKVKVSELKQLKKDLGIWQPLFTDNKPEESEEK